MRKLAIAALILLGGCTSPVLMRNPQTNETVDCGSLYSYGIMAMTAPERERACVRDYQVQGWNRVPK